MEITIEAISKNGKGIMSGGNWYNAAGKSGLNFSVLQKGQTIKADVDDKWIKSYTLADGTSSPKSLATSPSSVGPAPRQNDVNVSIARCTSVKAVLDSEAIAALTKDMSDSEAFSVLNESIKVYTKYILTGEFTDEVPF